MSVSSARQAVLSSVHIHRAVRCTVRLVIGTEEGGGGSAEK